ncbi:polyketide beta-ketoacyl-synthase [Tricholoma matsutake]|nr:polyketide beta-ketoacyl-synthase [Tricholoma matsutake 945]
MESDGSPLHILVFPGQGTTAAYSAQTRQKALADASSPSGSTLLSAFHQTFHAELSALLPSDIPNIDVDTSDFLKKESLLELPKKRYVNNPIISGPSLFIIQTLRYLAFIEATGSSTNSLTPFSDLLKPNLEHGLGILGFSSGILPACVAGTSFSTISYISRAVEAYRLAIWIGIRTQLYRRSTLDAAFIDRDTTLPWSLVYLGMSKTTAEEFITNFNKGLETPSIYITAIIDDTCVTISGRPDVLLAFSSTLASDSVVHKTTLDTLYHSPTLLQGVRDQVLADAASRNIQFPNFSDIKVPIRSTWTGDAITKDNVTYNSDDSLLKLVVDMVLTQPVNWNLVIEKVMKSCPDSIPVRLLNVGPGAGLLRSTERAFPRGVVASLDLTIIDVTGHQQSKAKQEPIAVVGMAVNMPGAPNVSKLWEILEQGVNTISEIPEHRFRVSDYNGGKTSKRSMKAHTGNFIDGVDEFDNKFFKISPREARNMDPQQRILLHTAYEALEDSGYVPDATPTFRPETFGCYIGVATHDYLQNLRNDIDVYYSTGTLRAFLSGRISYAMQLSGPSIVVDTACSSSNVALYQGARALMNRDCNAALVGGVNIVSSPDMFLGLDRGHFLSPTGQCKSFDASADGYSRSEGCGVFILKRLSDAISENDRILGVIRAVEVNQSGLAHSITHPHAQTQTMLFRRVLESAGMSAECVNVVEAHGTGTQAGDPSELESIRSVFANHQRPLHVTSIKANIGHLEAASGTAGLAKLLLMLKHRTIPRQISLRNLNPRIAPLEADNTVIDSVNVPWVPSHDGMKRVALLNNFGAAGSNTALLVEEYQTVGSKMVADEGLHYVIGLSAKDDVAIEELRSKYLDFLRNHDTSDLALSDIAYTSTARRQIYDYRISVAASTRDELVERLARAAVVHSSSKNASIVFVFSGQGGQYLNMGLSLYRTSFLFKQVIDECHNILVMAGFPGVLAIITAGTDGCGLPVTEELEAYQAAIFALEYALAKLWMSWGMKPAAVVGHSLGEYAALVIAGVVSLKGALLIIANRVRFMVQKCSLDSTGMIAVNQGPEFVAIALQSSTAFDCLSISCYNGPIDCVVSGPLAQIRSFKEYLDTEVRCKNVLVSAPFGYHSPAMAPLIDDLTAVVRRIPLHAPTIPVISNVFGDIVMPGNERVFDSKYFSRHCVEPVQFDKGIRALTKIPSFSSVDVWIEIGPHTSTLPMIKPNTGLSKHGLFLGSLRKHQEPWATLATSLSQLYASGIHLHWREVFAHINPVSCVSLPSYPFSKAKFWVAFKEDGPVSTAESAESNTLSSSLISEHPMLHRWTQYPSRDNSFVAIFETPIRKLGRSIRGHQVGGMPLCPASVYIEQVFAGVDLASRHLKVKLDDRHAILRKIEFSKPLVYDEAVDRVVITKITVEDGSGIFSIGSRVGSSSEVSIHVRGDYRLQSTLQTLHKFTRTLPVITRHMSAVKSLTGARLPEVFSTRTAYEVIFPRVVEYSKEYHTMRSLTVDASGMEACADVRLPSDHDRGKFVVHPVFTDTLLHVSGFVANLQGQLNDAYICSEVETVKIIPQLINNTSSYTIYCNNAWLPEDSIMLAEAYAVENAEPRRIVAHLKGMHFRRVRLDRLKKGLAHAAGKQPMAPSSKPEPSIRTETSNIRHARTPSAGHAGHTRDISEDIIKLVSETCGLSTAVLDVNVDLTSLGIDSLMSIEIFSNLDHAFPDTNLNIHLLSYCKSIADIIQEVSTALRYSRGVDEGTSSAQSSVPSSPRTLVMDDKFCDAGLLGVGGELDVERLLVSALDLNVRDIHDDLDLASLGLDSLTSIEILSSLKNEFGLELPGNFFAAFPTIRAVKSYLSSQGLAGEKLAPLSNPSTNMADEEQTDYNNLIKALRLDMSLIPIQDSKSGRAPLFLIHDGSGLVHYYDRLSRMDRPIWGINNPRFIAGEAWDSIAHMAKAYSDLIASQATGPVILGVAYEVSLQLAKQGVRVQGVLLIDSPSPIDHVPLSDSVIDSVLSPEARKSGNKLGKLVKAQFVMNTRMLGRYVPRTTDEHCPTLVFLRSREGYNPSNMLEVPAWLADRQDPKLISASWETIAGEPIKVIDIPGHHFQPFETSNIGEVSLRIADGCEYIERTSTQ